MKVIFESIRNEMYKTKIYLYNIYFYIFIFTNIYYMRIRNNSFCFYWSFLYNPYKRYVFVWMYPYTSLVLVHYVFFFIFPLKTLK